MADTHKLEAKKWFDKAKSDLHHAYSSITLNDFDWAQTAAQQSAEKALKAVCISKEFGLIKIHELSVLARKLNAPKEILQRTGMLSSFYSASRYPDAQELFNSDLNRKAAQDAVESAEFILKWCEKQIKT